MTVPDDVLARHAGLAAAGRAEASRLCERLEGVMRPRDDHVAPGVGAA